MIIKFHIHYNTDWGQQLFVSGSDKLLGEWDESKASPMVFRGNGIGDLRCRSKPGQL